MIKSLFALLVVCAGLVSSVSAQPACTSVSIAGPTNSPPSSWVLHGKLTGFSIELLQSLLNEIGVKGVPKVFDSWEEGVEAVKQGQVDIVVSLKHSLERERFMDFVYPSYNWDNVVILVKRNQNFLVTKFDDLLGRRGVIPAGTTFGSMVFGDFVTQRLKPTVVASYSEGIDKVIANEFDYFMSYQSPTESTIYQKNIGDMIEYVSTYPFGASDHIAVSKRSACGSQIKQRLTAALVKSQRENSLAALKQKYKFIFEQHAIDQEVK